VVTNRQIQARHQGIHAVSSTYITYSYVFLVFFFVFEGSRIAASGVSFSDSESENATFAKLEELMLVAQRCKSSGRLTNDCFTSRTNNTHCPVTAVGGTFFNFFSFWLSTSRFICLEITAVIGKTDSYYASARPDW